MISTFLLFVVTISPWDHQVYCNYHFPWEQWRKVKSESSRLKSFWPGIHVNLQHINSYLQLQGIIPLVSLKEKVLETNQRHRDSSMEGCVYKGGDSDRRAPLSGIIIIQYCAILIALANASSWMMPCNWSEWWMYIRKMRVMW